MPQPLVEMQVHNPTASEIWQQQLTLEKGKKYAIQAQSGKGKSTFLHLLYGLRQDFVGNVIFEKTNIKTIDTNQWATIRQQKIAIIFQDLRLFLHLTAEENILAKAYLTSPKPNKQPIYEMAERLQIMHLLKSNKKTQYFSYGERQRIAIIRALSQPFEWLLLDEPFSHLDADNVKRASELIAETCQIQGAGFLLTSLGYDYPLAYDQSLKL